MGRFVFRARLVAAAAVVVAASSELHALAINWGHVGSDWNTGTNWSGENAPGTGDSAVLNTTGVADVLDINISASTQVIAIQFDTAGTSTGGWNVTADDGVAVTLTGAGSTINNGATALRAYAVAAGSGANTVSFAPDIVLGAAAGATQMFSTSNDADTPVFEISGDISEANTGIHLNVAGGGGNNPNTIVLSGTNNFTGDFIASARAAVTSIGNKGEASAAGAGDRIVIGKSISTGVTFEYLGGAKTTDRDIHIGVTSSGNTKTIGHAGTGLLKFTGAITGDNSVLNLILRATHASGTGVLEFGSGFANYGAGNVTNITVRNSVGTIILGGDNTFGNNVATGDLVIGINATNQGGTVLVNGTTSSTADIVVAVGTLGGMGTIHGTVKVGNNTTTGGLRDSFLSPGNAGIGELTATGSVTVAGSDSRVNIELNDVGAGTSDGTVDLLTVGGTLTLTNAAVDFSATGVLNDQAYIFATYGSLTGTFAVVTNLPTDYSIDYNYLDTNSIALVAVPEPTSLGLLAVTGLGLLRRRRR